MERKVSLGNLVLIGTAIPVFMYAYSTGPPPGKAPAEYTEQSPARQANAFQIECAPPATDRGTYTSNHTLIAQATGTTPTISQGGVVNAWSFKNPIGDATWIAIFGSNLAPTSRTWRADEIVGGRLPTGLDGVSVKVNNQDAYVFYISPGQVNVQAPADGVAGPVSVQVATPNGNSNTVMVEKRPTAPALFTWAGFAPGAERFVGTVSAQPKPDGTWDYIAPSGLLPGLTTRAAKPGETVLMFATGCGPTTPSWPAGQIPNSPNPTLAGTVNSRIGGIPAQVAGGTGLLIFPGQCQFDVTVPANAPDGSLPVVLEIGGVSTQTTQPEISIPVESPLPQAGVLAGVQVAYRLDPWLIGGTYGGGFWASPPVFGPTTQGGQTFTLQTKADGFDSQGHRVAVSPQWLPSDPGMVTVSPTQGDLVTITINRAGESTLAVTAQGISKLLTIRAVYQGEALMVEIAQ